MARFQTHLSYGCAAGIGLVAAIIIFHLNSSNASVLFLVFLTTIFGAVLPDIDSDSGIPYHLASTSLAITTGAVAAWYEWWHGASLLIIFGVALAGIASILLILGPLFKRFTRHRGMAHSIPAAILSGLLLQFFLVRIGAGEWVSFLIGISLAIGYLVHLILDEACAGINFHGQLFVPNKAFGSALKLWSQSASANIVVYAVILLLVGSSYVELIDSLVKLNQLVG